MRAFVFAKRPFGRVSKSLIETDRWGWLVSSVCSKESEWLCEMISRRIASCKVKKILIDWKLHLKIIIVVCTKNGIVPGLVAAVYEYFWNSRKIKSKNTVEQCTINRKVISSNTFQLGNYSRKRFPAKKTVMNTNAVPRALFRNW